MTAHHSERSLANCLCMRVASTCAGRQLPTRMLAMKAWLPSSSSCGTCLYASSNSVILSNAERAVRRRLQSCGRRTAVERAQGVRGDAEDARVRRAREDDLVEQRVRLGLVVGALAAREGEHFERFVEHVPRLSLEQLAHLLHGRLVRAGVDGFCAASGSARTSTCSTRCRLTVYSAHLALLQLPRHPSLQVESSASASKAENIHGGNEAKRPSAVPPRPGSSNNHGARLGKGFLLSPTAIPKREV